MSDPLLDLNQQRRRTNIPGRVSLAIFLTGFAGIALLLYGNLAPDSFKSLAAGLVAFFSAGWLFAMLGLRLPVEKSLSRSAGLANLVFALAVAYALWRL